jgi:hypothetical protein
VHSAHRRRRTGCGISPIAACAGRSLGRQGIDQAGARQLQPDGVGAAQQQLDGVVLAARSIAVLRRDAGHGAVKDRLALQADFDGDGDAA